MMQRKQKINIHEFISIVLYAEYHVYYPMHGYVYAIYFKDHTQQRKELASSLL